jgi:hypothetical protein
MWKRVSDANDISDRWTDLAGEEEQREHADRRAEGVREPAEPTRGSGVFCGGPSALEDGSTELPDPGSCAIPSMTNPMRTALVLCSCS